MNLKKLFIIKTGEVVMSLILIHYRYQCKKLYTTDNRDYPCAVSDTPDASPIKKPPLVAL
jgi:hypothetical protein